MGQLDRKLTLSDWQPESLFGGAGKGSVLPQLIGVMMNLPQLALGELTSSGMDRAKIAQLANAWVRGESIEEIARLFFHAADSEVGITKAISDACKGIYRSLVNSGTWGLAALTKLPGSGIDFDKLTEGQLRAINLLPAMLYHGVQSEAAILMRMNSVPRSVAEGLGSLYAGKVGAIQEQNPRAARQFLKSLSEQDWDSAAPEGAGMSGSDYHEVWRRLSGEK